MLPFSTLLLRSYYEAIGWNEDNLYSNITRSSAALLDFAVPNSLILQLANAPTPIFFTSYALDALPQLNGSLSYITTSEPLTIGPSRTMPFRDVVERFRHFPAPRRPEGKPELWLGGRRIEGRDFLFYSRMHLPTMHLSGLAVTRLAPTLQAHVAFVHQPQRVRFSAPTGKAAAVAPSSPPQPPPNFLVSLQHDTGMYSGEYTYSAADGMFGVRGLYNFGWASAPEAPDVRGRFSAGGEVYLSVKQRSAGISTGVRYTSLPSASGPPAPPTTITLLYNPLIGALSASYAAQVSPHVSMATRFGVNVYSYESDFAIGGEWWVGRRGRQRQVELSPEARLQIARHAAIGGRLREEPDEVRASAGGVGGAGAGAVGGVGDEAQLEAQARRDARVLDDPDERDGVLKARLSGNWSLALLYEARIRKCLVSVGLVSDVFGGAGRAIRGVGLEVQYYS
ncbi:hypothetical protein CC85DRAFT_308977 [Cutaneotrichosporon oleaginosum]|uniref:Mitochondrial distribution and morphology protein 10 n=1 Tax=Cutaneotrichosporon oleaginosum TaxID=879819 RepID=A0A0J0XHA8_9TREE|nr:uncharacterized protein CC85DRAFT_308977 [Cutaneotrichosporon oleaginosum]KLT40453.1 hypothetical protein CC85DRAFT_308977 [Cutaneotrichosporon oleaginosum]